MIIDVIVFILVVLALFRGWKNGLLLAVFSFLGFLLGLAAALKLSASVADYLGRATNIGQRWLPVIAFALVLLVVILLVRLGVKALEGLLSLVMLGWLNRLGGIIFYLLLYLFIFSILLFYAVQLHFIKPETTSASVTYPFLASLAPGLLSGLAYAMPFLKNVFSELTTFFGQDFLS
jgi:membrane protein required for colicin V production